MRVLIAALLAVALGWGQYVPPGGGGGGPVPASSVTAGTFGAGNYAFPGNVAAGTSLSAKAPEFTLLGSLAFAGQDVVYGIAPWGRYAILATATGNGTGLTQSHFVDLSNIAAPVDVAPFTAPDVPWNPWVFGKFLYFPSPYVDKFYTYDVTNIHSPSLTSTINLAGGTSPAQSVIVGNLLYNAGTTLTIYDITNRALPVLLSTASLDNPSAAAFTTQELIVRGTYAYVGLADSGGQHLASIIDVSNPNSPVIKSTISTVANASYGVLALSGRYLFIGQYSGDDEVGCPGTINDCALVVYDVSDPTTPVAVAGVKVGGSAGIHEVESIQVKDNRLYIGGFKDVGVCPTTCELRVYDISNPAAPTLLSSYHTNLDVPSLSFYGSYLLVGTQGSNGSGAASMLVFATPGVVTSGMNVGSLQSENQEVTGDVNIGGVVFAGTALKAGPGGINSQGAVSGARFAAPNCTSSASPAACVSYPTGSVTIAAAATSVVVDTSAVSANSEISVIQDDGLGTKLGVTCYTAANTAPRVTARTAGTSFTITATAPAVNPACYSYSIIN